MESTANGGAEDVTQLTAELGKTLKEGERIVGPTRRPDGTLRKPIRIRAGYWKKEMAATQEVPPGYDPVVEGKRSRKQLRGMRERKRSVSRFLNDLPENVVSVASKMNGLSLSGSASVVTPPSDSSIECSTPMDQVQDIDKKIRALKRSTAAENCRKDLKPEQMEKAAKLEGWRNELKLLEDKKAKLTSSLS
ncbi:hypothetical protein DH2020_011196 [Rehmannia glutinosa]|uniref:WIBG Mago-binding domain-containing protein n=1 Tax=Rehmannia glutinosa TaxID=99300 RepID=A0ABR0XCP4_REHGL